MSKVSPIHEYHSYYFPSVREIAERRFEGPIPEEVIKAVSLELYGDYFTPAYVCLGCKETKSEGTGMAVAQGRVCSDACLVTALEAISKRE